MKKYYVQASYVVWCDAIIEAESEEEARQIAKDMDGADFTANGGGDWAIDSVTETQREYV